VGGGGGRGAPESPQTREILAQGRNRTTDTGIFSPLALAANLP
jgi:hypothetical protein